jgi:S-adenosylmethionine/arginine decarboxylase-like enzyme
LKLSYTDRLITAIKQTLTRDNLPDTLRVDEIPEGYWGYHLMVDGYDASESINNNKDITVFFAELIKALSMKELTPLIIKDVSEEVSGTEKRTLSAIQMITTSHISLHCDAQRGNYFFLDVFSCKKFDPNVVFPIIQKFLSPKKMARMFILRDDGVLKVLEQPESNVKTD